MLLRRVSLPVVVTLEMVYAMVNRSYPVVGVVGGRCTRTVARGEDGSFLVQNFKKISVMLIIIFGGGCWGQVYTYGSPRLGNVAFARQYDAKVPATFRVVVDGDIVAGLPKLLGIYTHAGIEVRHAKSSHERRTLTTVLWKDKDPSLLDMPYTIPPGPSTGSRCT
jgi:hypothetical protein